MKTTRKSASLTKPSATRSSTAKRAIPRKPAVHPFDFRSEGPPLSHCDLCGQPFKMWSVANEKWALLP